MTMTIAARLHPFSHQMGTQYLLPGTHLVAQVFPTRVEFFPLDGKDRFFLQFNFIGPVRDFTSELDLEQGDLKVWGQTEKGFMRYRIRPQEGQLQILFEKIPEGGVSCMGRAEGALTSPGAISIVGDFPFRKGSCGERLSLGVHKAQDWDLVKRRLEMEEIFPFWLRLAQMTPPAEVEREVPLVRVCREKIQAGLREGLLNDFERLFLAGFEGVCAPRLVDQEHQGIEGMGCMQEGSPLFLLTAAGRLIRSLFFEEVGEVIKVLPCLPSSFSCGRFIGIETGLGDQIDIEWSKQRPRRVIIRPASTRLLQIQFPKEVKRCRSRIGKDKGKGIDCSTTPGLFCLSVNSRELLALDRFEY